MTKDNSFHDYVMMEVFRFVAKMSLDRIGRKAWEYPNYPEWLMKEFGYGELYWELPVEIMEDRDELEKWVEKSIEARKNSKK